MFLSQVTLLHGAAVSTHSGIPGKSLMLGMQCRYSQSVSQQVYSTLIYHEDLIYSALLHLTACVFLCVFVCFFSSLMQRDKSCHSVVEITAFFK